MFPIKIYWIVYRLDRSKLIYHIIFNKKKIRHHKCYLTPSEIIHKKTPSEIMLVEKKKEWTYRYHK